MTTSIVVRHRSGVALHVDELYVFSAWAGILEGVPDIHFFEAQATRALDTFDPPKAGSNTATTTTPTRIKKLASVRWQNAPAPGAPPSPSQVPWDGPKAPDCPRYICVADARFDSGTPEGEAKATLAWFTNRAFADPVEELLQTCAGIALDGDVDARVGDDRVAFPQTPTRDKQTPLVRQVRVRFRVDDADPHRALSSWLPKGHAVLAGPLSFDAPVLARLTATGGTVPGPRNHDPVNLTESLLLVGFIAETPGKKALQDVVAEAMARVAWNALATPVVGD